jgi:hypothetical protein
MPHITNPTDFKIWISGLQRSIQPGEIIEVAEDLVHSLTHTGVLHVHEDAPPAPESAAPEPEPEVVKTEVPKAPSEAPETAAPKS